MPIPLRFLLAVLLTVALTVVSAQQAEPFTVALIPDTQRCTAWNPDVFVTQIQWLVDNARTRNIRFAIHLGDLTENDTVTPEWEAASAALRRLEQADLSYAVVPGNHDIADEVSDDIRSSGELFPEYFPPGRWQDDPHYGGHSENGWNAYHFFEGGGETFLVLALDYRPSVKTLEWATDVLDDHPTLPAILVTHDLVASRCSLFDETCRNGGVLTENGDYLWTSFIRRHDQIFLTVNGHSWPPEHLVMQNDAGHDVHMILTNYQAEFYGGNGLLRLLTFNIPGGTIENTTLSPWVMAKPVGQRGPSDIAIARDARNAFVIELDFSRRFASFQHRGDER